MSAQKTPGKTREARVRDECVHLISEHPAVKALRKREVRKRGKPKARPGVPKLLHGAPDNEHVNTSVTCWRRVMKYHEKVSEHNRKRLKGIRASLGDELTLIRQGANIEADFHRGIGAALAGVCSNSATTKAYASAFLETVP